MLPVSMFRERSCFLTKAENYRISLPQAQHGYLSACALDDGGRGYGTGHGY
jgi:hypothetical protein